MKRLSTLALSLLLAPLLALTALAQTERVTAALPPEDHDVNPALQPYRPSEDGSANASRQAALEEELLALSQLTDSQAAARFGLSPERIALRRELLVTLINLYSQIPEATDARQQFQRDLQQLQSDHGAPQQLLTVQPPYSLSYYDNYLDRLYQLRQQISELQEELRYYRDFGAVRQQQLLRGAEERWRLARDFYFHRDSGTGARWALMEAALELERLRALEILNSLKAQNRALNLQVMDLRLTRGNLIKVWLAQNLDLSEGSLDEVMGQLNEEVSQVEARIPVIASRLHAAVLDADGASGEGPAAEYQDFLRLFWRARLEQAHEVLSILGELRRIQQVRYRLLTGDLDSTNAPEYREQIQGRAEELARSLASLQKDLTVIQNGINALDRQIADEEDPAVQQILNRSRALLVSSISQSLEYSAYLHRLSDQLQYFSEELQERYDAVSAVEKLAIQGQKRLTAVLNTELWVSGDYSVRLKQALAALVLVILGGSISRLIIRWALDPLYRKLGADETAIDALNRFSFYFLTFIWCLVALNLVGIPLTAFAFLGGALAIAVGFGAQNLFNNLISGVILSFGRPFKIGDTIEIDGIQTQVKAIGPRSTRLRTERESDVLMPNSKFLEKHVTNWQLTDALARSEVVVRVPYGTSARLVKQTLLEVVRSYDPILRHPTPWVHFSDYGERFMVFTVYFWVNQKVISRFKAEGDIRFAIQDAFTAQGITT